MNEGETSKDLRHDRGDGGNVCEYGEAVHLYVLVHGFNSCSSHLKYVAKRIKAELGAPAVVYLAGSNQPKVNNPLFHPTHDGIDVGGERLAQEVSDLVRLPEHAGLRFISFFGNSLGGLISRYAFGLLFDSDTGHHSPNPSLLRCSDM
jgi:pimeloyl-ACP methyl ester carboxylesterase